MADNRTRRLYRKGDVIVSDDIPESLREINDVGQYNVIQDEVFKEYPGNWCLDSDPPVSFVEVEDGDPGLMGARDYYTIWFNVSGEVVVIVYQVPQSS